jgi:Nuclear protein 96/Nucleoporin autopeptidase
LHCCIAPTAAFGFGAPAPSPSGLFGATPAPAFGAPTPGIFGAPSPSGGLFGAPAPPPPSGIYGGSLAPAPVFGAFGSPPPPAPAMGLYGQQAPAPAPIIPPAGSIIPQAANEVLAHQIRALESKRKEVQKLEVWRGASPDEPRVTPFSQPSPYGGMSSSLLRTSPYTPHRQSPSSAANVRPRGFGATLFNTATLSTKALDTMGTGRRAMMSPDTFATSSAMRLVVKPDALTPKPRTRLRLTNTPGNNDETTPLPVPTEARMPATPAAESTPMKSPTNTGTPSSIPMFGRNGLGTPYSPRPTHGETGEAPVAAFVDELVLPTDPDLEYYQKVIDSDGDPTVTRPAPRTSPVAIKKKPSYIPKLTKPGYEVTPSLDELAAMSEADLATLSGFSVRHDPYGVVEWEGAVDVRNADLDSSIDIGQSDVSVYTRHEHEGCKPPIGSKLNRPAVITFFNVFPKKGGAGADEESKVKFARRIEKSTSLMEAKLILYDKDRGVWKIRVEHFSRYGLDDDDSDGDEEFGSPQGTPSKHEFEHVGAWRDEEDAAVVSDVEMVEESYTALSIAVKTYKKAASKEIKMDIEAERPSEDDAFFDEGYAPSWDDDPAKTAFTTDDDFEWAATQHTNTGICQRIANKTFSSERRIPKNLEYGLRLGRSFRVCWSPDGSFLKLGPGGTKLQRFRPVFLDPMAPGSECVKYLENHKLNSEKVPTSVDDGSPRMFLPLSLGNAGNKASHAALYRTLSAFAGEGEDKANAFALLASLIDESHRGSTPGLDARRKKALTGFLVDACQPSTNADILLAKSQNNAYAAVYAALTGGNLREACDVAVDIGQENLAACITTYDVEGNADLKDQVRRAAGKPNIPESLLEIYQLLSGDIRCSPELGWMRCFLVRLLYDSPQRTDRDIGKVLESFIRDLKETKVPFPSPSHLKGQSGVESILFRLIRLAASPQAVSCSEIIDPIGVSRFQHDFALSFHLASSLASAGMCAPLSLYDEEQLINSYGAQLVSAGKWEWAVYVSLCCLNPEMLDSSSTDWKKTKAKELILQNYRLEDPRAEERRTLLEGIGVPKAWFSEAVANRQAGKGDPFETIRNMVAFSPARAVAALEESVVPNILFMSSEDADRCLALLNSFPDGELSPLATAVVNMLALSKELDELSRAPREEVLQRVPEMAEILEEIENTFHAEQSKNENVKGTPMLRFLPSSYPSFPLSSMLSEANATCVFLRLKLKAHEMGIDVGNNASHRGLTALLAFHAIDGYNEKFSYANVVRGLR